VQALKDEGRGFLHVKKKTTERLKHLKNCQKTIKTFIEDRIYFEVFSSAFEKLWLALKSD